MFIGVPKEVKNHEYRVGITPSNVQMLTALGHQVVVQKNAGAKIGFTDEMYIKSGAKIGATAEEVYKADLIVKVKEPQKSEWALLRKGQVLFCYFHLAAEPELLKELVACKVVAVAYETVTDVNKRLPLLTPMSEVAGRFAIQAGAFCLQLANGGKGVLLGGVPGVRPARVTILGGGVSGTQAARMAMGIGAEVTILERRLERVRELDDLWGPRLKVLYSSPAAIEQAVVEADLVVGAVLVPGKKAPKLITEKMISKMEAGSVLVDVSIDQGGCSETSRPTTHSDPIYTVHGVVHYCVTNMPAATARTSTEALSNATAPFVVSLAKGYRRALREDPHLLEGLNVCLGSVTNLPVSEDCGYPYVAKESFIE